SIGAEILPGEFALPGIGTMLAAWRELVAPGIFGSVHSAARSELPFCLGGQVLAGPLCISERVRIGDMHDRMTVEHVDTALWAIRVPPVGALHELPPSAPVAEIDGPRRRRKHKRSRMQHVGLRVGIVLR